MVNTVMKKILLIQVKLPKTGITQVMTNKISLDKDSVICANYKIKIIYISQRWEL